MGFHPLYKTSPTWKIAVLFPWVFWFPWVLPNSLRCSSCPEFTTSPQGSDGVTHCTCPLANREDGNAERCLVDGSEILRPSEMVLRFYSKKNNLNWWVDPGFLVAINNIRGLTLKCATVFEDPMRIASVSWGLPGYFSPYYDDTTGKTTPGTPCTSCHNTDYMQDLSSDESCGEFWLIVGETSNIFGIFTPSFRGRWSHFGEHFSKGLVQPPTSSLPKKLTWHLLSCPTLDIPEEIRHKKSFQMVILTICLKQVLNFKIF